ncbi:hypothetical protein GPX89_06765 [Nocardia sp. ET3-3]|uniref:DUF8020 domain-containing protein n=1 Tax=Nocardia terrae TaxID=2675851 RepID=A0A7K1URH2_9NOCA|nr:hypothetical protein [Nocardia terrae]MVU76946.1 hypothetical protein [Nocardia terrae]
MNIRLATLTTAVVAAGVVGAAATATAAPETAPPAVGYHSDLDGNAVVTTLTDGSFALSGDRQSVAIRDIAGRTIESLPLSFTLDGQHLPLVQQIADDGRTLRLLPDLTTLDRTALKPVASPVENQLAMNDLINSVSLGTSIGSLIGTAIGAVAGIGVGVAVAGASCLALSLGCVITALPIISLVAAAGGLAGLVLGGGPTAIAAALTYFSVMQAAPGTSKYAPYVQGRTGDPAPAN